MLKKFRYVLMHSAALISSSCDTYLQDIILHSQRDMILIVVVVLIPQYVSETKLVSFLVNL